MERKNNFNLKIVKMKYKLLIGVFFFAGISNIQAESNLISTTNNTLLLVTGVVLLGAFLVLFRAFNILSKTNIDKIMSDKGITYQESGGFFDNAVSLENEADVLLDHEYDGIRELDNSLPPWWVTMFYGCIAIGFVYFSYYHVFDMGLSSAQEYELEVQTAEDLKKANKKNEPSINEDNVVALTDAGKLEQGKTLYESNCAACHIKDGGGGIGPNLTDKNWLHGNGSINTIFHTISEGVPGKSMIAWKTAMSPSDIQKVASFVLTLQGTTPAKPKEAEGELIE